MINEDRVMLLEEELLMVRHSGEMPEVALYSSLHYLTEDPEGPQLHLSAEEYSLLVEAAQQQYLDIILRDLSPENRGLRLFRGVARACANWQRLQQFCTRQQLDCSAMCQPVANALVAFLCRECRDLQQGKTSGINCSRETLCVFFDDLGVLPQELPHNWQNLCFSSEENC